MASSEPGSKKPPGKKAASAKHNKPKPPKAAKGVSSKVKDPPVQLSSSAAAVAAQQLIRIPTNLPVCIVDNGGWTVKYGLAPPPLQVAPVVVDNSIVKSEAIPNNTNEDNLDVNAKKDIEQGTSSSNIQHDNIQMSSMYNATARPPHQLTVLAGDEITSRMKNLGQLSWNYPLERGMICDGETQLRVWARVLEVLGVVPLPNTMMMGVSTTGGGGGGGNFLASIAAARRGKSTAPNATSNTPQTTYTSNNCAFLLLEPPFVPSTISEGVDCMLFRELGMARVARMLGPSMAAVRYKSFCQAATIPTDNNNNVEWMDDNTECCCVVDSGYSFTHIVPTCNGGEAIVNAIRRLNVGGKVLTNLLKESVTYRQWNMMDEYHIVNDAKEQLCFVSDQMDVEMKHARSTRKGIRWFDREYILPDFVNTFSGSVRLPEPLRRKNEMAEMEKIEKELDRLNDEKERQELEDEAKDLAENMEVDENEADDDKLDEQGKKKTAKKKSRKSKKEKKSKSSKKGKGDKDDNDDEGDIGGSDNDSDEETDQQRLQRLKAMREAERKRREQESLEHQALAMSVERFAIPEVLFTPNDIGLDCGGIAEAIVESIEACDPILRAAMYHNVLLVGGNAKLPGFAKRVELELRKLAPANYELRVYLPKDPVSYAWEGAKIVAGQPGFQERFSVDRISWESMKKAGMNQQNIWGNKMYSMSKAKITI